MGDTVFSPRAGPLIRARADNETRLGRIALWGSLSIAAAFLGLALATRIGIRVGALDPSRWTDLVAFAALIALGPYGLYVHGRHLHVKALESRFPDFLRDLAVSRKAGLTLTAAVGIAARGDYGILTPHIRRMADQLSWDVPFDEALRLFAERVDTPLVARAVSLIDEASRSGGNVTDVILAAARDAREAKILETERSASMMMYVAIVYITYAVFLGIVFVMMGRFVPEISAAASAAAGTNAGAAGLTFGSTSVGQFRTFYFLAALLQGIGNGIVAGILETGRAGSGMRHAFFMTLGTIVLFLFL